MTFKTRNFKIYELDINISLILLAEELSATGEAPIHITYDGIEDNHTLWKVEVYLAE